VARCTGRLHCFGGMAMRGRSPALLRAVDLMAAVQVLQVLVCWAAPFSLCWRILLCLLVMLALLLILGLMAVLGSRNRLQMQSWCLWYPLCYDARIR
jgi:hypothetical protein